MAPPVGGKRKRGDRSWSGDSSRDGQRPSPHRPGNLNLAQQGQSPPSTNHRDGQDSRGRGGRRASRGGRGGYQAQYSAPSAAEVNNSDREPLVSTTTGQDATQPAIMNSHQISSHTPITAEPVAVEPANTSPPFDYSYLTSEICEAWEQSGRQSVLELALRARAHLDMATLSSLFQELVQAVLDGRLPATTVGQLIKEIIAIDEKVEEDELRGEGANIWQGLFLDTLSITTDGRSSDVNYRLQSLLSRTGIPPEILRQELDSNLLESLSLIRSTFARMGIRKQTNILYRQANFNLMREESEGFAKLMTELYTTSNNEPPTYEVVEDTVERVKAMIGAFDLDVGRTLDVVLDVFGAVLVKQFRFFVRFLRASPWWPTQGLSNENVERFDHFGGLPQWALPSSSNWYLDDNQKGEIARITEERDVAFWARAEEVGMQAFYELGRRSADDSDTSNLTITGMESSTHAQAALKEWIRQTGTLPVEGNRDAAQLLGFKLRFYSSSDARGEGDVLPENLIYLSALLIKIGFISLKDLYPHIWRPDEDMEELKTEKTKQNAERERAARPGAGAKNALLMAGALADDTIPAIPTRLRETGARAGTPAKDTEQPREAPKETKTELPTPVDQKVLLLQNLLAIGALPDALFILGRFPWLLDVCPELQEYFYRILHHCLSRVYSSLRPLSSRFSLEYQKPSADTDVPGMAKGQVILNEAPARKTLKWPLLDRDDNASDGLDYRFYWDEWSDNIPICQSVDDVFILCKTFVNLSGARIGQDPALLSKLARIGKRSLVHDGSGFNRSRWANLCKILLIPALSFTRCNAGVVNDVFEVVSNFAVDIRYAMYAEWTSGRTSRSPEMKSAVDLARAETRDVLKRISKTNLRPMARALAKVAYANPHIVVSTALNQIENYDSIADAFVEGARYFTYLGYDVLTWALISTMGRAGRSRVQEDNEMLTSKWLSALASFAGKIFKRYNMMKATPILQYVADQLAKGNARDLIVLEQIMLSMAGITTDSNYNDAQIQAMGGGELLQAQTRLQLLDRRHESRTTSKRLMRSLREAGLTARLLISLAQRRKGCVFDSESEDMPLKMLGNQFDELNRVMVQYLDLLRSNLSAEELDSALPDVVQLLLDYGLNPEVAFSITRPIIAKRMAESDKEDSELKRNEDELVRELTNGDVEMTDQVNGSTEEDGEAHETEDSPETAAATPSAAEISGTTLNPEDSGKQSPAATNGITVVTGNWHPVLQEIMDAIQFNVPQEVLESIGLGFYVTFWQLSLYDVTIPGKSYEDEISRQNRKIAAISADRTDISIAGTRKKEAEKKQISDLCDRVLAENKAHLKAFTESRARLQREKDQWFPRMTRQYEQLNSALMEYCFLPRILLSPLDAYFCFKFVKLLHTSATPNFRTLGFYDLIFKQDRLTSLIFSCTANESDNLGRFLNEVLRDLGRWHKEKSVFEREAYGSKRTLPGFAMKLEDGKPTTFLSFEDFRRILFKWHNMVFSAIQNCLSSTEYMHIRNAISVLNAVSQHFPAINFHGTALQKILTQLGTSRMTDVQTASRALMSSLSRREKSWLLPQAFRRGQDKPVNGEAASNGKATKSSTSTTLDPVAVDFKPGAGASAENANATPSIRKDGEDGEVNDAEMTDAPSHPTGQQEVDDRAKSSAITLTSESQSQSLQGEASNGKVNLQTRSEASTEKATLLAETAASLSEAPPKTTVSKVAPNSTERTSSQAPNIPKRPEPPRSGASPAVLPPNLPSKPERPEPRTLRPSDTRFLPRPPAQMNISRETRDSQPQSHNSRTDPPSRIHAPSHDRSGGYPMRNYDRSDRMGGDRTDDPRDHDRGHPVRGVYDDRPPRLPPSRELGHPLWDPERAGRSRPPPEPYRNRDNHDRPSRESDKAAPQPQLSPPGGTTINPARAALISGTSDPRPGLSIKGQADERPTRSSQPSSPRREEQRSSRRSDRSDGGYHTTERPPPNGFSEPRNRLDQQGASNSKPPYSQPQSSSSNDFPREPRHQPPSHVNRDLSYGRLQNDSRYPFQGQEHGADRSSNSSDVPSGPRTRGSMSAPRGRNATQPAPHINTNQLPASGAFSGPPTSDRPTPTGPSSRPHTRSSSYHEKPQTAPVQSPASLANDTTGVHQDRLRLIQTSPTDTQSSRPPPFASTAPPQSPVQSSPPSAPAAQRGIAPSGAPSGPSPTTRGPPPGQYPNSDPSIRGGRGNRHPLAAVNNHLQSAGQGTSIRGRGGMRNATPYAGPPSNSGPSQDVPLPPPSNQARPDLFIGRGPPQSNGAGPHSAQDIGQSRPPTQRQVSNRDEPASNQAPPSRRRGDLMDETRESDRRTSSRHSSSRARSPERDPGRRSDRERDDGHRDREREYGRDRDREHERDRDYERDRNRRNEGPPRHGDSSSSRRDGPTDPNTGQRRSERTRTGESEHLRSGPPQGSEDSRAGPGPGPGREENLPPRKHGRGDEGAAPYGGGPRGGARMASESKRPRRGEQ